MEDGLEILKKKLQEEVPTFGTCIYDRGGSAAYIEIIEDIKKLQRKLKKKKQLTIICDKCGKELEELGALLFSPSKKSKERMKCEKFHLCKACYEIIIKTIKIG